MPGGWCVCGGRHRSKPRVTWGDRGAGGQENGSIEDLKQKLSFNPKSGPGLNVEEPNIQVRPAVGGAQGVRAPCCPLPPLVSRGW